MKHNTLQKLFVLYQREEENIQVSLGAYQLILLRLTMVYTKHMKWIEVWAIL